MGWDIVWRINKLIKVNLRFQIVVTFIGVVLISLFLSFLITRTIFVQEFTFRGSSKITIDIATLIATTNPDKADTVRDILAKYDVESMIIHGDTNPPFSVSKEKVAKLFQTNSSDALILSKRHHEDTEVIVGVPNIDDTGSALVLKLDFLKLHNFIEHIIFFSLVLVLLIGSLLFLLASLYIVEPLKRLTKAAKEMATGNLLFRLKHKRKDEFGDLMDSFNHMACELQKSEKAREDFVSNVSHEIQSPLTSIRGFTKAIRDDVIPPEHQKEYLNIIYQESLRLSHLSENLLRLASLDSEYHPFQPDVYKLDEQLRQTILLLEPQWKEKDLKISLVLQPCEIKADKDLFEQVWQNLINNAIKYSDIGGLIEVKLESTAQQIKVFIRDTGHGINEEELPFIFDRFYMVDKARRYSREGNGLGLSIARKIVILHGSHIEVTSKEGQGSTFVVSIPRFGS